MLIYATGVTPPSGTQLPPQSGGSSSFVIWGDHTSSPSKEAGNTVTVGTPDFCGSKGRVKNRTVISRHANPGGAEFDHVVLADAGGIYVFSTGMNETGLTVSGGRAPVSKDGKYYPNPNNLPQGFLPPLLLGRYVVETQSYTGADLWNSITNLVQYSQPTPLLLQVARRRQASDRETSVAFESSTPEVPGYAGGVRRFSDWNSLGTKDIVWDGRLNAAGELLVTDGESIYRVTGNQIRDVAGNPIGTLSNTKNDSAGLVSSGDYSLAGKSGKFYVRPIGYYGMGTLFPDSNDNTYGGSGVVATNPQGTSGYWISRYADFWGTWQRDNPPGGTSITVFDSNRNPIGTGTIADSKSVGVAVTFTVGSTTFVGQAWKRFYKIGAGQTHDPHALITSNVAWLPNVQPYIIKSDNYYSFQAGLENGEARYRSFYYDLTETTALDVDSAFALFRSSYTRLGFHVDVENPPFGLAALSSKDRELVVTFPAWIGGVFYNAVNSQRIPIKYTWSELLGPVP